MRSFAIAAVMTALVAGIAFVAAPEPRAAAAALRELGGAPEELARPEPGAERAPAGAADRTAAENGPAPGKRAFYQWTDARGTVRFARSLEEVPAEWRARAGRVEVDAAAFEPKRAAASASERAQPAVAAKAAPDVTVYTAPWCGWCRKTLAFLDARGVAYVNKDVEADRDWAVELKQKSGGTSIPFVEIDGTQIRGYNPNEMAALLD
jgi:glutaredoxin